MANFSIKVNLLKLTGAFVSNIKGKTSTKRCVVIPVDDSRLFVGEKGVYLNLTAIEMREARYDETHCLKLDLGKEERETMTEEEIRTMPILGGLKPIERRSTEMPFNTSIDVSESEDDLPF